MLWAIIIISALFGVGGFFLVFAKRITGRVILKWEKYEFDAPIGIAVVGGAFYVLSICSQQINPSLQKKIDLLNETKGETEKNLKETQSKLDTANQGLDATKESLEQQKAEISRLKILNEELKNQVANDQDELQKQRERTGAAWETIQKYWMSEDEVKALASLEEKVEEINKDLSDRFRIDQATLGPTIKDRKAFVTFEIYQKSFAAGQSPPPRGAGLFRFVSEQYTIQIAQENRVIPEDQLADIVKKICLQASGAAVQKLSLGQALSTFPTTVGFDLDKDFLSKLEAFKYVVKRLELMAVRPLVVVRGYADGEVKDFHPRLDRSDKITLHKEADPKGASPDVAQIFEPGESSVEVGQRQGTDGKTYSNMDLPNLRAEWIADNLGTFLNCDQATPDTSVGPIPVWVLEGRPYPNMNDNDRKVRVYLLVSLKEPSQSGSLTTNFR